MTLTATVSAATPTAWARPPVARGGAATRGSQVAPLPVAPPPQGRPSVGARSTGPVTITREDVIQGAAAEQIWQFYWEQFEPLTDVSVQRQHSEHEELTELLANPAVTKYIGWSGNRPVGFSMITNSLGDVPEMSPRFLRRRYPEHAERNAIYVLIYVVVDPAHRGLTLFHRLTAEAWQLAARDAGILVCDMCEHNRQALGADGFVQRMANAFAGASVTEIDRQTWYAAELRGPLPERAR